MRKKYITNKTDKNIISVLTCFLGVFFIVLSFLFNISDTSHEVAISLGPSDSDEDWVTWTPETGYVVNPDHADEYANWMENFDGSSDQYYEVNGNKPTYSQQPASSDAPATTPSTESAKTDNKDSKTGNAKDDSGEVDQVNCEHDFVLTTRIEPTCTDYGSICYECSKCHLPKTDAIEPGHKFKVAEEKAVSCTEDGYKKSVCTACGEELIENKVAATGHTEVKQEVPATLFKPGSCITSCSTCGEVLLNETIPQIIPVWAIIVGSILIVAIGVFVGLILKNKKK